MKSTVKWITRTAILLALSVLFQSLRVLIPVMPDNVSQFVVGSLVNLCLILAAIITGIRGGLVVAVIAPVIAYLQGFTPVPVLVVPIALGNLVLVIVVALLHKRSNLLAFAAGAVLKFFALYLGVVKIVVPFFLPANAPEQMKTVLLVQFSWPQLITAAIGGILALIILPVLKKAIEDL